MAETALNFWKVGTYRDAGLEAKWSRKNGRPCIVVRNPQATSEHQREGWWVVDLAMSETMQRVGIVDGFDQHTLLGDLFSI